MELFTEADHLAEARYRKLLREQPGFVWRRFSDGEELMAYVFFPPGHRAEAAAPSVLFFHGGMWVGKSLGDFVPWGAPSCPAGYCRHYTHVPHTRRL